MQCQCCVKMDRRRLLYCVLISTLILVRTENINFDNCRVISVKIGNEQDRDVLEKLGSFSDLVHFSPTPSIVGELIDLIAPQDMFDDIQQVLDANEIQYKENEKNIQRYSENFSSFLSFTLPKIK